LDKLLENAADALIDRARKEFEGLIEAVKKDFFPEPKPEPLQGLSGNEIRELPLGAKVVTSDATVWTKISQKSPLSSNMVQWWASEGNPFLTNTSLRREHTIVLPFDPENLNDLALQGLKVKSQIRDSRDRVWTKSGNPTRPWRHDHLNWTGAEIVLTASPVSLYEPETGLSAEELYRMKPQDQVVDKHGQTWTRQFIFADLWDRPQTSKALTSEQLHAQAAPLRRKKSAEDVDITTLKPGSLVTDKDGLDWFLVGPNPIRDETKWVSSTWKWRTTDKLSQLGPFTIVKEVR
jgi:hypothetical protein